MDQQTKFLSTVQLRQRWGGVSHMFLERRLNEPHFPQPVRMSTRLGSKRLWPLDQIEQYERHCATKPAPKPQRRRAGDARR
jgi:hypothetical protein